MPRGPRHALDRSPPVGGRRKVVWVTRGASRLGQALTVGLADAGFDLAVEIAEAPKIAAQLARAVRKRGRRILLLDRAPGRPEPEEGFLDEIASRFGRLDALVTVPGPPPLEGEVSVEVILEEPFRMVRSASSLLKEARGSVVHCLDEGGPDGSAPLRALTRTLSRILAPWIRVNAVAPPPQEDPGGPHPPLPVQETVRAVLYVLASPHLNGEVVQADHPA